MRSKYRVPKKFYARLDAARNVKTPKMILAALAADRSAEIRLMVAANPNTPLPVWLLLLQDEYPKVRTEVAARKDLEIEHIHKLAKDDSELVWCQLAIRKDLDDQTFQTLLAKSLAVRLRLASRATEIPDWVNVALASDNEVRVRKLLAGCTPTQEALQILKEDESAEVQNTLYVRQRDADAAQKRILNKGRRLYAY
ncbi:MAG: hypothetical protein RL677_882 [Actinomycetota bacterium]|jgi:ribosomal protein L39E